MNGEVCDDSRESGRRLYRRVGDDSKWVRSKVGDDSTGEWAMTHCSLLNYLKVSV